MTRPAPQPGEHTGLVDPGVILVQTQDMHEAVLEHRSANVVMLTCGCIFAENRPPISNSERQAHEIPRYSGNLHHPIPPYTPMRVAVMLNTEHDTDMGQHAHGEPWLELHLDRTTHPPRPSWTPMRSDLASRPYHV